MTSTGHDLTPQAIGTGRGGLTVGARSAPPLFLRKFFMQILYIKSQSSYDHPSLDERRLTRPTESGRIRLKWTNRRDKIPKAGVGRYSRHEGLAPVRYCPKARNRFGLFLSGRISAGRRIDRPVLSPVLGFGGRGAASAPPVRPAFSVVSLVFISSSSLPFRAR